MRLALILSGVALFTAIAAWLPLSRPAGTWYRQTKDHAGPQAAAFLLTLSLLSLLCSARPGLFLSEQFFPAGAAWLPRLRTAALLLVPAWLYPVPRLPGGVP